MPKAPPQPCRTASTSEPPPTKRAANGGRGRREGGEVAATEAEKRRRKRRSSPTVKTRQREDAHRAEETAFTALEAKTKASEQRASDEGAATQGLRVKLEVWKRIEISARRTWSGSRPAREGGSEGFRRCASKELQDALDAANKQLKKEASSSRRRTSSSRLSSRRPRLRS